MTADDGEGKRAAIGARLREAREYLGFSQDEVAAALRLQRTAVTNIESGSRRLEATELERLSQLYGHSVGYLLSGVDPKAEYDVAFAARTLKGLTPSDLAEVARFANYLRSSSLSDRRRG
jgi:DNA-binding XRE family transcriptional regulator